MKKCEIGGQAVLEGVMMKAPERMAIAVRCSDGHIEVRKQRVVSVKERHKILKWPIIRGIVTFGETMVLGIRSLMLSAELSEEADVGDEYKPSKFETMIADKTGKKPEDIMIYFALVISILFAIFLFIILPTLIVSFARTIIKSSIVMNVTEGAIRLLIFIGYVFAISRLKDIQRVFEYHGGEHKTIHCYEHGEELSVENVRKYTTLHPRCGTAFLLVVMVVSIFMFSFLGWKNIFVKMISRIILLPIVAGISYEIIKWAGRSSFPLVKIIIFPGLMLQKLTTREPDDQQLEVAIKAFLAAAGLEEGGAELECPQQFNECIKNGAGNVDGEGCGNPQA